MTSVNEADLLTRPGRDHEVPDRFEDLLESVIIGSREIVHSAREICVFHECTAHLYERTHDVDAGLHRNRAVEDARKHECAMFSENVRRMLDVLTFFQGCILQP